MQRLSLLLGWVYTSSSFLLFLASPSSSLALRFGSDGLSVSR